MTSNAVFWTIITKRKIKSKQKSPFKPKGLFCCYIDMVFLHGKQESDNAARTAVYEERPERLADNGAFVSDHAEHGAYGYDVVHADHITHSSADALSG